jgi:hypothetical protein
MKRRIAVLLLAVAPVAGFAQMTPQYSSYASYTMDSSFNVYQTVVVDGQTTGSCTYTYTCGQYGQQCTGTIPGCSTAVHTPSIYNVIGSVGGWSTGPGQSPWTYMSYQTTVSANVQPGQEVQGRWEGKVACSSAGTLLDVIASPLISIKVATYALATVNPNGTATYNLSCPAGTTSTCGTAHLLGSQVANWAEEFAIFTRPGGCWFANVVQYKNGPPAPYPCT